MLKTFIRSASADPVVPTQWVLLQFALSLALLVLLVASLISIARTKNQPPPRVVMWVLIVFLLPFIGPIFWFIGGRKTARPIRSMPS
ncbi:PLD nuclease N-terminal domain-containing protein [Arthrobacter cryoconiti]|uniref:PLD nuclease N-terminal domain-containing protein n=1 Tax=Arthrobacter cryoconiti TaxID=748907 RepID=A0ABV8QXH7_9MICC